MPFLKYKTCIGLSSSDNIDEILEVCRRIRDKDRTFRFRLHKLRDKDKLSKIFDYILIIASSDKDTAHRRGLYLINKVNALKGKYYWVRG